MPKGFKPFQLSPMMLLGMQNLSSLQIVGFIATQQTQGKNNGEG